MPGWDTKTYEKEISHRLKDPGRYSTCRRNELGASGVIQIYCKLKDSDKWEVQSLHYLKSKFTLAEAKAWEKDHPEAKGGSKSTNDLKDSLGSNFDCPDNILEPVRLTEHWERWKATMASNYVLLKVNTEAGFIDKGEYVVFPKAKIASEGIMNEGLRTKEETKKMIPFCNSLRVIVDHPPFNMAQMAALDLKDEDYPVIGWTENATESELDGITRVEADICIMKKDRNENDLMPLINQVASGVLTNISIGYFYERVPAKGEAYGQAYNHEEVDVNPYHLAILTDSEPACAGPICGIGVASRSTASVTGGTEMAAPVIPPGQGGQDTPPPMKTSASSGEPISAADMSVHALAGVNANVKALVDEKEALKVKVSEEEKKTKALEEDKKKGDEAVTELEAIKKKEREEKEKAIKEGYSDEAFEKLFPEDTITKIGEDELGRHLTIVQALKAEPDPAPASDASSKKNEADPILKGAGQNTDTPPHNKGLTIGDHCKIEPYKPITKEDFR